VVCAGTMSKVWVCTGMWVVCRWFVGGVCKYVGGVCRYVGGVWVCK